MWSEINNQLVAEFYFSDFKSAFAFMNKIAEAAEEVNHHPKMINDFNKVKIELCTHDAGSIVTDKDRNLAETISKLYREK